LSLRRNGLDIAPSSLTDSLSVGILRYTANGKVDYANEAAAELFSLTKEQLFNAPPFPPGWEMVYPNQNPVSLQDYPMTYSLRNKEEIRNQTFGVSFRGDVHWMAFNTDLERNPDTNEIEAVLMSCWPLGEPSGMKYRARHFDTLYHLMIENVEEYAILLLDAQGYIIDWNKGAEKIKGYTANEILGSHFSRFYTPKDIDAKVPWRLLQKARETGKAIQEGIRVRKDGTRFWAIVTIIALFEHGQLVGYAKITRDMSERRRAEEELANSEQRFRDLTQNVPGVIFEWDENEDGTYGFTYISPKVKEYFGLDPEEMHRLPDMVHPQDREGWRRSVAMSKETGMPWEFKGRFLYPDGSIIWWHGNAVITERTEKKIVYNGILQDISEQVRLERLNKRQEEQIRLFVKYTPAAVAMLNQNLEYVIVSDRWRKDYDLGDQDLIGKHSYDLFPEIQQFPHWKEIHNRCLAGETYVQEEEKILTKDGSELWLHFEIHPWYSQDQEVGGIIIFSEVITQQVKAREHLRQLNASLRASNADLQQFAYVASHDLQEPLRMVSSFLQLLEKRYAEQLDEKAKQYIDFAVNGATRMKRLINDLLNFSRVGTGEERWREVDMNELMDESKGLLELKIAETGARIEAENLPTLKVMPSLMRQLFQNLLDNALKYRNGPPVIIVKAQRKDAEWEFSFQDNGLGFDDKFAKKIFVIFQRLHSKSEYDGTGLGLAICKRIIDRHGGRIWATSEPGVGSTFYFTIPES